MKTRIWVAFSIFTFLWVGRLSSPVWAESVADTIESLARVIRELEVAKDRLEQSHHSLDDEEDLHDALAAMKEVRQTMRSIGCDLIMHSVDVRRSGDLDRILSAMKTLEP